MEDKELTNVSEQETVNDSNDYIEAIREIKQNSVDKAKYNQLKEENQRLLKSLVNGETIQQEAQPVDIAAIRKELFSTDADYNNLDYMTKVMALRDTLIEKGEKDPFLPWGDKITPSQEDVDTAERVASIVKECIDYAEGDSMAFTNELQRRMIDTGKQTNSKIRR